MKKLFFYIYVLLLGVLISDPYGTIIEHIAGEKIVEELSLKEKEKEAEEGKELELEENKEESLASYRSFSIPGSSKVPTQSLYIYQKSEQRPYVASEYESLHLLHESFLC